jgi:hypothetical protein
MPSPVNPTRSSRPKEWSSVGAGFCSMVSWWGLALIESRLAGLVKGVSLEGSRGALPSRNRGQPPDPALGGIASSSGSCRIVRESPQPTLTKHGKYTVGFENAFARARTRALPVRGFSTAYIASQARQRSTSP